MSRSKRARQKARRQVARRAEPEALPRTPPSEEASRLSAVRRRAQVVKLGVGVAAAAVFGASMVLARVTYAGHSKTPVHPLSIPQPLYQVVRRNLLQAGILAPAKAPPDATTSTS